MTDDTAFCLKAREKGYKFIADYGLIVPHWGYTIKWKKVMQFNVQMSEEMTQRRAKMQSDRVYVHPESDLNITEAVKKLIDIDKIKYP